MKVRLEKVFCGFQLVQADRRLKNPRSVFFQTDYDYPSLARMFGYVPCACRKTDGTVACEHKTASDMISEAYDVLCAHDGDTCEDPSYFDGDYE